MTTIILNEALRPVRLECAPGETEVDILAYFSEKAPDSPRVIISWNGRGFDIPVIICRSMHHGIVIPWLWSREARDHFSEDGHVDLMDHLSNFGAARFASLDGAARSIGLPGKAGTTGSDVAGMVARGEIEQVRRYCLQDVVQTTLIYFRYQLVRGSVGWGLTEYKRRTDNLLTFVKDQMPELVAATDIRRLLLT